MSAYVLMAVVVACIVVVFAQCFREEVRRNRVFAEQMERLSRRCPACQPWGGWYLGRMREDGSCETHVCEVCGGTGEIPSRGQSEQQSESGQLAEIREAAWWVVMYWDTEQSQHGVMGRLREAVGLPPERPTREEALARLDEYLRTVAHPEQ